jgi:hypothetical protein
MTWSLPAEDRHNLDRQGYKLGKMTLQIKFGQPIPKEMIIKILQTTAKTNQINQTKPSKN